MRPLPVLALVGALSLSLVACGGDDDEATTTTTTPAGPTTTRAGEPGLPADAAPLTALTQPDVAFRNRVALVVKIDNAPLGRPQSGLNQADIVYEEMVEGGVTRLAAVFQSADADPVGPVRSARSTDIAFLSALNRPLFAYAGTNAVTQKAVSAAPLVNLSSGPGYRRDSKRKAPYNLFSSTGALFARAPKDSGPPPPQFRYRPANTALASAGAAPVKRAHIQYKGKIVTDVDYEWNGSGWARKQNGTAHVDTAGAQVAPANVVIQFVAYKDTGLVDRSNTGVPEGQLIGEGEVWVLSDGRIVKGKWTKANPTEVTRFTDPAGAPIALTPGRTWVELAPPGTATSGG
ncbi:MAG TPA: DUF3048 domain-containing protein [Acidimicrobiales bacterium]|nr:DUF3048 domain-containing protein [Acidimicrobiales bacterium]